MIRLNPYLSFDGDAREAMQHYRDVLGGELTLTTFGEFGMPDAPADLIMHSQLEAPGGLVLMGADTPPGMQFRPGSTVTLILNGDDESVLRGFWEGLSAQGRSTSPWSRRCGATPTASAPTGSASPGRSTSRPRPPPERPPRIRASAPPRIRVMMSATGLRAPARVPIRGT